jgi:hypothetical protein
MKRKSGMLNLPQKMKKSIVYLGLIFFPNIFIGQIGNSTNLASEVQYHLKQSEWEKLTSNNEFRIYFRISSIGNYNFMDVRIVRLDNKEMNIKSGQTLTFDLLGDSPVVLTNPTETNSSIGGGALSLTESHFSGIEVSYIIRKEDIAKLRSNIIFKVLIGTSDSTLEASLPASGNNSMQKAITTTQ